jgi:hypothetical protein
VPLAFPMHLEHEDRSELPLGGSPADDRAYLAWRDQVLGEALDRHVLRHWHRWSDEPFDWPPWRFDAALFAGLEGRLFRDPIISNHRLRALAVALKTRRRKVESLARQILSWR